MFEKTDANAPTASDPVAIGQDPVKVEDSPGVLITRRALTIAGKSAPKDDLAAIAAFYSANPDKPLWLKDDALSPRARLAMAELRRADDWGLDAREFALPAKMLAGLRGAAPAGTTPPAPDRTVLYDAEARLTLAVLKYARHARGGRMDPTQLSPAIDRKAQLADPKRVLEQLATTEAPDAYLRKLHPPHPQFEKLRRLYNDMRIGKAVSEPGFATLAPPDGDPADDQRGNRSRQRPRATSAVAEPVSLKRVLFNMEQWRWMPRDLGKLYVTVNIPEFTLRVVKNGQVIHTERIVAGEVDKPTPIFSQDMQSIVFHPGWGVPNSIKVKELLPGLQRGRDTLGRNGLQVMVKGRPVDPSSIDWSSTDIRNFDVVQPPGPSNVLGVVKFQFPNKHDVYMHDTPTKNLFNSEVRAFSHGCMRVRNPLRLAEILFAEDQGWPADRVTGLVRNGPLDNKVMLAHKIPVHITYFTLAFDEQSADRPKSFRDVYGHQPKFELGLDGKAYLIPKPTDDLAPAPVSLRQNNGPARLSDVRGRGDFPRQANGRTIANRPPEYRSAPRSGGEWVRNALGGF